MVLVSGAIFGYFINQGYCAIVVMGFAFITQVGTLMALRRDSQLFCRIIWEMVCLARADTGFEYPADIGVKLFRKRK